MIGTRPVFQESRTFVRRTIVSAASIALLLAVAAPDTSAQPQSLRVGPNVNMVSGTSPFTGDPWLQRQNEPSVAVSTRNPCHLLAGANDYRTVDMPGLPDDGKETGDAWLGLFKSFDCGRTWRTGLVHGYPQDTSAEGKSSPLFGLAAGADPIVRAGTNGLFFYSGIVFDRGAHAASKVFVARFIDNNDRRQDSIDYVDASVVDTGTAGQFADKPYTAVDIPRGANGKKAKSCTVNGQSLDTGNVYIAWTRFVGDLANNVTKLMVARSTDCGATWENAVKVSEGYLTNQGATMAVDPNNGTLYVAWRQFLSKSGKDAILVSKSTDFGGKFSKATLVAAINPFDQKTSGAGFRTFAYPTMAVDGSGKVYVAWSQRGVGPGGDARIVMAVSNDGVTWSAGQPVANDTPRGHQIMPAITIAGGRLQIVWYDLHDDHTYDAYVFNSANTGSLTWPYTKTRKYAGDLSDPNPTTAELAKVFWGQVEDVLPAGISGTLQRRHTIDVQAAQLDLATPNAQWATGRVSQYAFGTWLPATPGGALTIEQMEFNPPNLPLYAQGTSPFIGDYVDVAALAFVRDGNGVWRFNVGSGGPVPTFYAVWTDNRDVSPPPEGSDWTQYSPPKQGCAAGRTGMRNANVYTAAILPPLVVGSLDNSKPLNATRPRAFPVFAQNTTDKNRLYRFTIVPSGSDVIWASFVESDTVPETRILDGVWIGARSGVARTVYAKGAAAGQFSVRVEEVSTPNVPPSGGQGTVLFNPDPLSPAITNPAITNDTFNPAITNRTVDNPAITNPAITNPAITNPADPAWALINPAITNPAITNPAITNPAITNPAITNPAITNPAITNPAITNPAITNPAITNVLPTDAIVTDVTWTVRNDGSAAAGYVVKLAGTKQPPSGGGFQSQLILHKRYVTPAPNLRSSSNADVCSVAYRTEDVVLANIINPVIVTQDGQIDVNDPAITNATMALAPGEEAFITLRIFDPDRTDNVVRYDPGSGHYYSYDPGFDPATDVAVSSISEPINEPPLPAGTNLSFSTQPSNTLPGQTMTPAVKVAVAPAPARVTVSLVANGNGGILSGTFSVDTDSSGVATFSDLRVSTVGTGYQLRASVPGSTPATSLPFNVGLDVGVFARLSVASDGTEGAGDNGGEAVSADGRYAAFYSLASLVPDDTNGTWDVYLRDTCIGAAPGCVPAIKRVSVGNTGQEGNGASYWMSMSDDGRFIAFTSEATNLVAGDTNGVQDLFVRDTCAGASGTCTPTTARVSVAYDGSEGNGDSGSGMISGNGRFIVFESEAANLVPGDTNGVMDVFVRDTCLGAVVGCAPSTKRISVAADSSQSNGLSIYSSISFDGGVIAFRSAATNLVPGDTNGLADVFAVQTCVNPVPGCTPTITRISVAFDGSAANGASDRVAMTSDGRFLLFGSAASNLVAGDVNGVSDVFLRDTCLGAAGCVPSTTLVSVPAGGSTSNGNSAVYTSFGMVVAHGKLAVFESAASNLVPGDTNSVEDVFLRSTCLNSGPACVPATTRLSVGVDGSQGNGRSGSGVITGDARHVELRSEASNLVAGDTNGVGDLFLARTGIAFPAITTAFLPTAVVGTAYAAPLRATGSTGSILWTITQGALPDGLSLDPATGLISGVPTAWGCFGFTVDARDTTTNESDRKAFIIAVAPAGAGARLVFLSQPQDGNPGDPIRPGIWVLALDASNQPIAGAAVTLGLGSNPGGAILAGATTVTTNANGVAVFSNISVSAFAPGVTLTASAGGLAGAASEHFDVLPIGVAARVSLAGDGSQPSATSYQFYPDTHGRFVAFTSEALNLLPGDLNGVADVFVRDTCLGARGACAPTTGLVSMAYDGSWGNGASEFPSISADGRFIAFDSAASNLVAGDTNGANDVFVRDTCLRATAPCTPTTTLVSVGLSGGPGNDASLMPSISADGRFVAFESLASNLVSSDTNFYRDIFVRDTCFGAPAGCVPQTTRVSVDSAGTEGNAPSVAPAVSPDGRFVGFTSAATNLVASDTNGWPDAFVRDTCVGAPSGCVPATVRASVADNGAESNGLTYEVSTVEGRFVAFASTATNLVTGDTNGAWDVFLRDTCLGAPVGCTPHTIRVSVASDGTEGNNWSLGWSLSARGRFVAFSSFATNLVPGDTNGALDVFVRDTCIGAPVGCVPRTVRASVLPAGGELSADSLKSAISRDGRFVTMESRDPNGIPGDTNGVNDGFLARTSFTGIAISDSILPRGLAGTAYSVYLHSSGAVDLVGWTVTAGALPSGLTFNTDDGLISGTPTTSGSFTFTVEARDKTTGETDRRTFTIKVI